MTRTWDFVRQRACWSASASAGAATGALARASFLAWSVRIIFLVQRSDGDILEERIGAKSVWSVFDPKRGRVVEQPTPAEQARRSCLSHAEVNELVRLAVDIEMREGCP